MPGVKYLQISIEAFAAKERACDRKLEQLIVARGLICDCESFDSPRLVVAPDLASIRSNPRAVTPQPLVSPF